MKIFNIKQYGLSLVELMIAITLGLFLMLGVIQMFLSSKNSFTSQQSLSRVQETGRLAIEFMDRDIRMSGYYGCISSKITPIVPANLNLGGIQRNFDRSVEGYTGTTDFNAIYGSSAFGSALILPANSNILVLRGGGAMVLPVTAANATTISAFAPGLTISTGCLAGEICSNSVVNVSDCTKSSIVQLSQAPTLAGNTATLTAAGWGATFDERAEVSPMRVVAYFVANSANQGSLPVPSPNPNPNLSLYQQVNGVTAEILENVENIHFTYNIGNNNYVEAATLSSAQWSFVTAIRVEVLARSADNAVDEIQAPFTFAGATVTPIDRRLRKVFTTIVDIRSR